MKIRLTKDLPGADKDSVFELDNEKCFQVVRPTTGCHCGKIDRWSIYDLPGWYEEIKEWWIVDLNSEVKLVSRPDLYSENDKATYPVFRTKESAEKYLDALKETYGNRIECDHQLEDIEYREEARITFHGEHAKRMKDFVDALNDRVQ